MTQAQRVGATALLWLVLLTMPFWIGAVGGYTELASRVVVMALAATALNFLLGYTGTLSFGHAAYFGLAAYGAGMTLKYVAPSTGLGMLIGVAVGTLAAAAIGALIVRLRGVYFAMVTIAFGQVFYFIAFRWNTVTGGDDGLTGWRRLPLELAGIRLDIQNHDTAFYYLALACFALSAGAMALESSPSTKPTANFAGKPQNRKPATLRLWLRMSMESAMPSFSRATRSWLRFGGRSLDRSSRC